MEQKIVHLTGFTVEIRMLGLCLYSLLSSKQSACAVLSSSVSCLAGWPTGRPDHDQQHCYHHATTVKPEAATAVVELLMMGARTPETC
jgi:hypothetical protein